jgi:hypothetical protein
MSLEDRVMSTKVSKVRVRALTLRIIPVAVSVTWDSLTSHDHEHLVHGDPQPQGNFLLSVRKDRHFSFPYDISSLEQLIKPVPNVSYRTIVY